VLQGVANFGIGTLVAREFRRAVLAFATLAVLSVPTQSQRAAPPEPQGYRTENYRAATPAGLAGAHTLSTAEAEALWRQRVAVFIDVMPHPPRPQNLPAGTVWRDKPRFNIPGSIWLPDTGYGELAAPTEAYLRMGLAAITTNFRMKALVFYCQRDCWMSWNAAKRALAWGYGNVFWYAEGTDGWQEKDLPLERAQPFARSMIPGLLLLDPISPGAAFAVVVGALREAFPVSPTLATLWLLSALALGGVLLFGWQRLVRRI